SRLDAVHLAGALEHDAFVDEQRGRDDVAVDARGRMQLDRPLGANVAVDASLDDDDADLNFGLDLGALADDQDVIGEDLAAKLPVDTNGPLEGQLPFKFGAAAEQRVDFPRNFRMRLDKCRHGTIVTRGAIRVYYLALILSWSFPPISTRRGFRRLWRRSLPRSGGRAWKRFSRPDSAVSRSCSRICTILTTA